jgi:glycolate oxidase iron-sulfur subunit
MGREAKDAAAARRNIDAWTAEIEKGNIVAIASTSAGCGTTLKNYGFLLRNDGAYAHRAAAISALARDISELVEARPGQRSPAGSAITVAYHSACSLQHGQKIHERPMQLLAAAGFAVSNVPEGHLCCGSAGVYNILQPEIATRLRSRKTEHIEKLAPDIVAAGNVGCIVQLSQAAGRPVVHTIELLDWAAGGPVPAACRTLSQFAKTLE